MKNTKTGLLLLDILCAWLLASGAGLVLLPGLGLQAPAAMVLPAAGILLGVFALCRQRPWLPPAVLGAVAFVSLAAAVLSDRLEDFTAFLLDRAGQALRESLLTGDSPHFALYLAVLLPVAGIFWVILRRFPSLWAVTALSAALIGYKVIFLPQGWLLPFLLLCAGNILYLPRAALEGEGRMQAQLLAILLAVPVLGLALFAGPKEDGPWRWEGLVFLVQDFQDFWEYHWGELPSLPGTSMGAMGLQPDRVRLGGDLDQGNDPVISCRQNLLLRGQVFDLYTGSLWEDSAPQDNGNFRLDSWFWQSRRQEAFGLDLPVPVSKPLLDSLLTPVEAELFYSRRMRSLFLPYRTSRLETNREGDPLYFNMQGELYWSRQAEGGYRCSVAAEVWNCRDRDFDRNMLLLEKAMASAGSDARLPGLSPRYLQLPDTLPAWVGELAEELTKDCGSPYEKAFTLRDYLSETCQYTLTPGPPKEGEDFVAAFLADGKGYCTYYASALTVLCRCAGVPARYVTGYGMVPDGKRFQATQSTAHAWTEVYLAHIGWVPIDALSQAIFTPGPLPDLENPAQAGDGRSGPEPTPQPSGEEALLLENPAKSAGFNPLMLLWLLPVIAAGGVMVIGRKVREYRFRESYVSRKFPQPPAAAEHYYGGLLRLLKRVGLAPEGGETLLVFWKRAQETLRDMAPDNLAEIGEIMNRLRFGGIAPTAQELAVLHQAYWALERSTRKALGPRGWFVL